MTTAIKKKNEVKRQGNSENATIAKNKNDLNGWLVVRASELRKKIS